jgi:hypothetical protein
MISSPDAACAHIANGSLVLLRVHQHKLVYGHGCARWSQEFTSSALDQLGHSCSMSSTRSSSASMSMWLEGSQN